MELGLLKPLFTSALMPLVSLPLLWLVGTILIARRKRSGWVLCFFAFASLWLLSCQGTAVWLARAALPQYPPTTPAQLKANQVQAIVVLGGGSYPQAPEYGVAQPSRFSEARLRYGIRLSRQSGLPVAVSGGTGWAAGTAEAISEAQTMDRAAKDDFGFNVRWLEDQSRDTAGNARLIAQLFKRENIQRIALVTDALHMPRAISEFERTGLVTTPAPTGYILPTKSSSLQWLPSVEGISDSTRLIHEVLGLFAARLR